MVLASIAIAQSSLVFQTITHNRILTPSIMGFDALYLLTQVLVVVIFGSFSVFILNPFLNFALSVFIMIGFSLLLFGFYFKKNNSNVITLLLLGVIFGQLFSNISSFFMMLVDPNEFSTIQGSMFASFNNINKDLVYFCVIPLLLISALLFRLSNVLDIFWLDNDNATNLGVDVGKVTKQVLILVAILISVSTALVGPVMFFGLLVANLAKEFFHTYRHRTLLMGSSLMAMSMLLSGQWVIENVFKFETTLSVVINFIGGLYFLSLLVRQKIQ
ncbi:UNVERIFIED_CONTAM: hypothetical protein GTU68_021363 [Idotea baltica]|nr:hypothetical protein [Idotea baltica]